MKVVVFVDVQNDFIDGALPVDKDREVTKKIAKYAYVNNCEHVPMVATRDTHFNDYLDTFEGKKLPIKHCIARTDGWKIASELMPFIAPANIIDKFTFGAIDGLHERINKIDEQIASIYNEHVTEIEICGFCTNVCVVNNALILRAAFPKTKMTLLENLCAGTTKEDHDAAVAVMKSCQIDVCDAVI